MSALTEAIMDLKLVIRYTYLLGWAFGAVAVIFRLLEKLGVQVVQAVPLTSRGVLFFAGFLFVACIASCLYAQATAVVTKDKAKAAAA